MRTPKPVPYPEGITFQILGMDLLDRHPYENGDRLVAFFDLSLGFIEINSCHLVLESKGYARVTIPKCQDRDDEPRLIWRGYMAPIVRKALEVYRAMGGTHAAAFLSYREKETSNG